ncbi:NTF2-related export protein [Cloeon dipterum]|uniref:NTF2-related export protein n=1 Tax=Cloeon dipterum TaxID=197152 RepID=UPI00321F799B
MNKSQRDKNDLACQAADEFCKLYYECMDKTRHLINKLYLDSGLLVYNGTGVSGKDNIQKFIAELPATNHTISSLDAQPISEYAVGQQSTLTILIAGNVRIADRKAAYFVQDFTVTVHDSKWRIVSDCFRLQEPMP